MKDNDIITMKLEVFGRVQGVGFRMFCCQLAEKYQITGTVRNRVDGAVEMYATATQQHLDAFMKGCYAGNGWSQVKTIKTETMPTTEFSNFKVII